MNLQEADQMALTVLFWVFLGLYFRFLRKKITEGENMTAGFELGFEDENGEIVPFKRSESRVCYKCGVSLTVENDSGWEVFGGSKGNVTYPVCESCWNGPLFICLDCEWKGPEIETGRKIVRRTETTMKLGDHLCPQCSGICRPLQKTHEKD